MAHKKLYVTLYTTRTIYAEPSWYTNYTIFFKSDEPHCEQTRKRALVPISQTFQGGKPEPVM